MYTFVLIYMDPLMLWFSWIKKLNMDLLKTPIFHYKYLLYYLKSFWNFPNKNCKVFEKIQLKNYISFPVSKTLCQKTAEKKSPVQGKLTIFTCNEQKQTFLALRQAEDIYHRERVWGFRRREPPFHQFLR